MKKSEVQVQHRIILLNLAQERSVIETNRQFLEHIILKIFVFALYFTSALCNDLFVILVPLKIVYSYAVDSHPESVFVHELKIALLLDVNDLDVFVRANGLDLPVWVVN
jgi:hypothetical protein